MPDANRFIEAYENFNEFSTEILVLFNNPAHIEMKKNLSKEFDAFSAILSEAFNLPSLYNSPDYKLRMAKATTTFMALIHLAQALKMISAQQLESIQLKFNKIASPAINKELPAPQNLKPH